MTCFSDPSHHCLYHWLGIEDGVCVTKDVFCGERPYDDDCGDVRKDIGKACNGTGENTCAKGDRLPVYKFAF